MDKAEKKESLEEMFTALDETVTKMETEELSLDDSFTLYHKGMELLKKCNEAIDQVEKKMLVLDEEGDTHEFEL